MGEAVKKATYILRGQFEKNLSIMKAELGVLKAENSELKMRIINTERATEKNEQCNRKKNSYWGEKGFHF